jgi:hypothetical protein
MEFQHRQWQQWGESADYLAATQGYEQAGDGPLTAGLAVQACAFCNPEADPDPTTIRGGQEGGDH